MKALCTKHKRYSLNKISQYNIHVLFEINKYFYNIKFL